MSSQLERVYKEFKNRNDFLILSHTVAPEEDSVSVLMDYAKLHGVNDNKWFFLTGEKQKLYSMARQSYLLNAEEGNGGEDDFIHTQNFALVDKEKHLRGFYEGTDSLEVTRLIADIKLLLEEYDYKEKHP
jgi:protein SCO1/2